MLHDAHMVADILQLTQVVGGDEHRGFPLGDLGEDEAPHLAAHDRVEAVHRLVQNEHIRAGADAQLKGCLLLHALGKAADLPVFGQLEGFVQAVEQGIIEVGVDAPVEFAHILRGGGGVVEDVVGDGGDARLGLALGNLFARCVVGCYGIFLC